MSTSTPKKPLSEEMQEEAKPRRKPSGAPGLYPFMALPPRVKAQFFRCLQAVNEGKDKLPEKAAAATDEADAGEAPALTAGENLEVAVVAYELFADMQDGLRLAAVDTDAFDAWCTKVGEQKVSELFMWYMDRFQVGEAKASSS